MHSIAKLRTLIPTSRLPLESYSGKSLRHPVLSVGIFFAQNDARVAYVADVQFGIAKEADRRRRPRCRR